MLSIARMKYGLIILICILLSSVLIYEAKEDSGTYDEVAHITAGYTYLYKKDFRLYPDNPALIKMISVLPWLPLKESIKFPDSSPNWTNPLKLDQWGLGKQFLYQSGNDADRLIFLARLPAIAITILLGLLVYTIAKHFYGQKSAVLSLFLFALSPDIRAHGHLATTDVGATFFVLLATFLFYLSFKKSTISLVVLSAFFFSLAILSKYSMILVLLSTLLISLICIMKKFSFQKLAKILLILLISYISLWIISIGIGYQNIKFSYDNVPLNQSAQEQLKDRLGWKIIRSIPLPYYYKTGLETMYIRNIVTQPTYLYGLVVPTGGFKPFFPISYILKTPAPILILLMLGVAFLIINKNWIGLFPFTLGLLFFLIIITIGNLTIGTRFYYPATVLFIITAAASISYIKFSKEYSLLFGLLGFWLIATNILSSPYDISYVNELGGGTSNGYNALVDSSYDWGQDLKRFAKWYKENANEKEIKMSYIGTADPAYYGIKFKTLKYDDLLNPSGLIAISVTNLKLGGIYSKDRLGNTIYDDSILEKLKNKKPLARIGTTIFVYEF